MQTRDDMIRNITEQLGDEATRADGALAFDWLRGRGAIQWDDRAGFVMDDDVDVVGALNLATWPIPHYVVDADPETGEWIGEPRFAGTVNPVEWAARSDTDAIHFDTYQHDEQTRAIEIRWRAA